MSDPMRMSEEERARAALKEQADEINRLERAIAQQYGDAALPVPRVEDVTAPDERLFSRRTLIGWAIATLLIVFVIRMVLPVAFESAKESIVSSLKASTENTAAPATATTPPTTVTPAIPPEPAATAAPAGSGTTVIKIVKKH